MATEKMLVPQTGYFFDNKKHYHYLNGKKLTGVTTVLGVIAKPQLIPWAVNMAIEHIKGTCKQDAGFFLVTHKALEEAKQAHVKKKEAAAESGTDVHAEIEKIVKEAILKSDGYILQVNHENKQVQDFIDWVLLKSVRFLDSEKNIFSQKLWIGGIVDLVMEIGGKVYIGDIKTSKYIYSSYWWQTSAYQYCLQEMGMYPEIAGHIIIKTSDRTGFEVQENFDFKGNIDAFIACYKIYKQLQALEK